MFFKKFILILLQTIIVYEGQNVVTAQGEYYGKEIGQFGLGNNAGLHGVQGTVYAIDNTRLWIVGFSYDGQGPDAFLWAGNSSQPDYTGEIIPFEFGSQSILGAYNNQDIVVQLKKGKFVTDYKWISVWCRAFSANFAEVLIPDGFEAPSEYLLTKQDGNPLELGFSRRVHNVHADKVYIMDTRRIRLENLDYDGNAPNSNYWIADGSSPNSNGWPAWDENWSDQNLPYDATKAFDKKTVIVTIPPPYTVHDIGYLSLWCITFTQDFGHVVIPDLTAANIPPYVENQGPYYGKELGSFVGGPNNAPTSYDVDGQVFAVDSNTLLIKGFTYNGQAPATYLWIGSTEEPSADGQIMPVDYSMPKLRAYVNEDIYVNLPRGTTLNDFKWISVWCEEAGANFGHVYIPADFVAPAEHDLNQKFPSFYPYAHNVHADGVYVVDDRTIRFENLNYDGNAPDTYYWTGPGREPTVDGWIASDSVIGDMMLPNDGIGYTDKTVTITMPDGYTVFEVGHIGLWCRLAQEDFGHVTIPPRSQLNVPPSIEKPQYYGAFIGEFTNTVHGVTGKVYAIDNSRLWLVGFSYDGLGPDTYLYAGTTPEPDPTGEIIPIEYAKKEILHPYNNEDVVVRLPKGKYITDYKWISVWCVKAATSFAHVTIPSGFLPPMEQNIGMLGYDPPTHNVHADKVYVIDTRRFRLENLYYDGLGPDSFYWYGPGETPDRYGLIPLDENWSQQQLPSDGNGFENKTVIITLPEPMTVFDVGYLSLWCVSFRSNFGHINIPAAVKLTVPPYVEDQGPYYGADLGAFSGDGAGSPTLHGVDGTVFAIDDRRIQIIGFSYDGLGPDAYVYVGTTDMPSGDGTIIPVQGSLEKLGMYDNEDIIVTLPEGMTINDFKWISIWCKQAQANFGHVWIPSGFQPPAEHNLNQHLGYSPSVYGVSATGVFIVDDKTIRIENLNYDGNAADASYWFGPGYSPDVNGMMAVDMEYSDTSLPSAGYTDKTVTLTLPDGYNVFDLGHIGIWCPACTTKDLGHVKIPPRSQLNVPPYVEYEEVVIEEEYYGVLIGELAGSAHDVAGKVYAIDASRLWLIGFNYDGTAPDAFLWAGDSDMPDDNGEIISIEYPRKEVLGGYSDSNIVVQLPKGKVITDYKWISVWCRTFAVNFGHVAIPANFEAPAEFRIPGGLGLMPRQHNVHADAVYIIDTKRFRIENLDYDGNGPDTFYWTGVGQQADTNGWEALDENWSPQQFKNGVPFNGKTVIVTLPGEYTIFDVDYIGLWCKSLAQDFGHVLVPDLKAMNINVKVNVPPYVEDQGPYYGADLGAFSGDGAGSPTLHGVDGTVFAIDDRRIQIIGFSYDGLGPDAFVYVGSTDMPSADGMIAPVGGSSEKLGMYDNEDIIVTLPEGTTINDFKWISIWCRQAVANFGHVMIDDTFQAPAEHNLQQMFGFNPPLHGVSADAVYVVDTRTLRIEKLSYDGSAPDTYYWAGEGMPDTNGFIVLDEYMRDVMLSTELVDKTVTVTLPEGKSVFDIDYLSLWCRQASANFGHVTIPPRSQLNVPPPIEIVVEPYYGKELGVFSLDGSPTTHGVAGTVYAIDNTRLWITGFSYDGLGPDAFLWVGTTDAPGEAGYVVPVDGSTDKLGAYDNAEFIVTLPDGMTIDHYKWISVWCRQARANFGHVPILADFVPPSVHVIQQTLANDPPSHGVQADSVEILDTRQLRITNLNYDGQAPDTYIWAGKGTPDANGFIVPPADGSEAQLPSDGIAVTYESVVVLLPEGVTVFDIDYIGLWCKQAAADFGHVEIPAKQDLNIPPYIPVEEKPYYGKELGVFSLDGSPTTHGVAGTVYAIDNTRLWITGFSYDGLGPDAFLWVGTTDAPGEAGYVVPVDGSTDKLGAYDNAEFIVTLPDGMTIDHYKWISVWCRQAKANFGHVSVGADFIPPSVHVIQQTLANDPPSHGVQADSVEILDTRQLRITNLNYDGQAPDTYIWAGKGTPDANGFIVPPADGSEAQLPSDGIAITYESVVVLLPEGVTVFDIDYIGLWCKQAAADFGHVEIPAKQDLNIPPYIPVEEAPYYGKELGVFSLDGSPTTHGVAGTVYAIDDTRLWITGFSYDGLGPDAFLWVGTTDAPGEEGYIVPVDGSTDKLGAYDNAEFIVTLPDGMTIDHYKWISVWCRLAKANFGHVSILADFVPPSVHVIQQTLANDPPSHGVQADSVEILDTRQLRITNLNYDGQAPDTYIWAGKGTPDANGFIVPPADGSEAQLPSDGQAVIYESVVVLLPEGVTVFDIDYIGLWCKQAAADFGHVEIPAKQDLNIPPYVPVVEKPYYGKELGVFSLDGSPTTHGVAGTVYAIDDTRLWITGFSYDGLGPDAFLWVGTTDAPGEAGYVVPVDGSTDKLGAYDNAEFIVTLPDGMTIDHYKWISVWCRLAKANFAHVYIPGDFVPPAEHDLGMLGTDPPAHDVQADRVVILNTRQFRIENLNFDGAAPDTHYWAGKGTPDSNGFIVLDENLTEEKLPSDGTPLVDVTVTVTLPEGKSVFDIDYLSLWCKQAAANFGHVVIPAMELLNIPPYIHVPGPADGVYSNCEVLDDNKFHVSWTVAGDMIDVELKGVVMPDTYLAFGISGSNTRTSMIGADVAVGWIDPGTNEGMLEDYYLNAYEQCVVNTGSGACPDTISSSSGLRSTTLVKSSFKNGITTVSYRRPLDTGDTNADKVISTDQPMYIAWAIGPINPAGHVAKHRQRTIGNIMLDFGRQSSTCPLLSPNVAGPDAPWIPAEIIAGTDITTFRATMGQAGGTRGYEGITGRSGWGIAWYLNNEIIPVLTLTRGVTYTFEVLGGDNPNLSAQYHPFYITDDPNGGYFQRSPEDKQGITIFAGPTEGPLCSWESRVGCSPNDYATFAAYRDNCLTEECASGDPGLLTWTPDENTPDLVYYQCYTHRFLGWKIHVVDPPSLADTYYGKLIGELTGASEGAATAHGVAGNVYAIDDKTLWVRDFSFDGNAPDPYFWVGNSAQPDSTGDIAPFDINNPDAKLGAKMNDHLIVSLPEGKTLADYTWISVWCRLAQANFAQVYIPGDFVPPAEHDLGMLGTDPPAHDVQADKVVILNTRQFRIENLNYDGTAPDTYYWAGTGTPDSNGFIVLDENMMPNKLPNDGTPLVDVTVTVTLPEGKSVFDIDYLSLWCRQASANFGHVVIPAMETLNIPPYIYIPGPADGVYSNCEVLDDNKFHVSWTVAGGMISIELKGVVMPDTYLAFGISGSDSRTSMIGADVAVGWIDPGTNEGMLEDYYLNSYEQCVVNTGSGACPDTLSSSSGVRSTTLVKSSFENGITTVSYRRALDTGDSNADKVISTDQPMYIAWAIGPINPAGHVAKHRQRAIGNVMLDFGRQSSTCPMLTPNVAGPDAPWIPAEIIAGTDITTFHATMGQAGGTRGYEGITGRSGWGIAWYLNNEIIPVLTLTRGVTYTFEVLGGDNPSLSAQYHPFYITDDPDGGYFQKSAAEQQGITIFAGPTEGPLCSWESKIGCSPNDYNTFAGYRDNCLTEECASGDPGLLTWTPDENTPDLVYYQCYTHRFLGWKIHVVDPPSLADTYYGKLIGELTGASEGAATAHGVAGNVYAIDDKTLWVRDFSFDGNAPDPYFWVGNSAQPDSTGEIAPFDINNPDAKLGAKSNDHLIVSLPKGKTLADYTWISVWCRQAQANFAQVYIPGDFVPPAEHDLGTLGTDPPAHDVQADKVVILNTRQFRIENLNYDGTAPDTYYWAGKGTPDGNGFIVLDENMMPNMLPNDGTPLVDVTVTVTLPQDKSVFDIDYLSLWCRQAAANFGHVVIPAMELLNIPPYIPGPEVGTHSNCEVLVDNKFHVSWTVAFGLISIELQGVVEPDRYLAFGISGSNTGTSMIGADVAVGWIDPGTNKGKLEDYHLNAYGQCVVTTGSGACPDTIAMPSGVKSTTLIKSSYENGITSVSYRRPLDTGDTNGDKVIRTDQPMYIAWAIGPINPSGLVAKHRERTIGNVKLDFGRQSSTCPVLSSDVGPDPNAPWIPAEIIAGTDITTFRATMGQAGGTRGYEGITGRTGWGIAWYLNNEIIPVLTLTRGVTYTFEVLGGDNPSLSAQYHPFYITDDPDGGYFQKSAADQQGITIFAGPTEGPLCQWESKIGCSPNDYATFAAYRDNCLTEECASGDPGVLTWTPDENTPDLVYYQCYTHRYLGWKIHVVDPPSLGNSYYGKLIGEFVGGTEGAPTAHGVAGKVYAIDDRRLWIRDFSFDGQAPDAYFWLGNSARPDASGEIAAVNFDNPEEKLGAYNNEHLIAMLPPGKTLADYTWLSVWCRQAGANFAQVLISNDFVPPAEHDLGMLGSDPPAHDVQADKVVILNTRQFRIENLNYDGTAPDTHYWAGKGTPDANGFIVLDENLTEEKLPSDGTPLVDVTVTVTLPEGKSVFDIDYLSLWCIQAGADFGHVVIPPMEELNVIPYIEVQQPDKQYDNCEVLIQDEFHASWSVQGDMIEVSLSAKVEQGTYMAFGRSGSDTQTIMFGSDVVVAWITRLINRGRAVDYKLNQYGQCTRGSGACPDQIVSGGGMDNVELLSSSFRNGISTVTYRRPLDTGDAADLPIPIDQPIYVSWAIGPINPSGLVVKHSLRTEGNLQIDFGRQSSTCPSLIPGGGPPGEEMPWKQAEVGGEGVKFFRADIGQSGGKKGYEGIVGRPGWGIAWYINWELIPIITVKRGETYTFDVFGGDESTISAAYHPFYITNDPDGGYVQLTEEEKQGKIIYAGPVEGALCEWVSNGVSKTPEEYPTFAMYRDQGLVRNCIDQKKYGTLTWTPNADTPDTVYYQCYTHKYLGWKIHVVDEFPPRPATDPPQGGGRGPGGSSTRTTVSIATIVLSLAATIVTFQIRF